jgi:hypothetical protein
MKHGVLEWFKSQGRGNDYGDAAHKLMSLLEPEETYQNLSVEVMSLLDTGASVNVLPYNVGVKLGSILSVQFVFMGYN